MSQPEFARAADDGDNDDELYDPITYEQDYYEPDKHVTSARDAGESGDAGDLGDAGDALDEAGDDVWLPGRMPGEATPVAGTPAGSPFPAGSFSQGSFSGWAPPEWAPPAQPEPEPAAPTPPPAGPMFTPHPVFPRTEPAFPQADPVFPRTEAAFPQGDPVFPRTEAAFPQGDPVFPRTEAAFPQGDPVLPPAEPMAAEAPYASHGGGIWPDESWPPRLPPKPKRPRWLLPGAAALLVIAAAVGVTFALAGSGSPRTTPASATSRAGRGAGKASATSAESLKPPLTLASAQAVLAKYTADNNTANAQMSQSLLAGYETGSSLVLDAGLYTTQRAEGTRAYPAFEPVRPHFYIPLETAAYPHWFAAQVTDETLGSKPTIVGDEYLVFTQAGAGAPWNDAVEPYLPHGEAPPSIAISPAGYATAVTQADTNLAVAPGQMMQATASSLDGHGHGQIEVPGTLADQADKATWLPELPKGTYFWYKHAPSSSAVVGLRTTDGGALLFYTDLAIMTFTPPHGGTLRMTVPGYYDRAHPVNNVKLLFLEQFATYDPPSGGTAPRVVASYSGIDKKL